MTETFQTLVDRGWLEPHRRQVEEVAHLWQVAISDIERAEREPGRSAEARARRFELAWQGAAKLCLVVMYAEGFRPARGPATLARVASVLAQLPGLVDPSVAAVIEEGRQRRERPNGFDDVAQSEVRRLLTAAGQLRERVRGWLRAQHADVRL